MKRISTLFLIVFILFPLDILSQTPNPTQLQKRIALVIGNGNYTSSILANPENDARSMSEILSKLGFVVYKYENLNQGQMKKAMDDFGVKLKDNDVGLFFYAGHGIQSKGYNYLIPVDANLQSEQQVEYDCVQADRILALMEASGSKVNIIILDACRNNPFERSWTRTTTGKGLAFMNAPKGTLIAYATSPGSTASDGSGKNGLYTSAILESIIIPNITILQMFQQVRSIVSLKSNDKQTPWESTSLTGDFYFFTKENISSENQEKTQEKIQDIDLIEASTSDEITVLIDSRDKQRYKIVKIGNQIWMAENLRTNIFNDGEAIPLITNPTEWSNSETPAYCWYNDNETAFKPTYGALYNWYSVNTGKLCPTGWHVPTDVEWTILTTYLARGGGAGGKLKEIGTIHWNPPNTGATNETGFTALPGGYRFYNGAYNYAGNRVYWWSSTEYSTNDAWNRNIYYSNSEINRLFNKKANGLSVRCLKNN
jgi:uncharacterized protein (TIGR02145 family)